MHEKSTEFAIELTVMLTEQIQLQKPLIRKRIPWGGNYFEDRRLFQFIQSRSFFSEVFVSSSKQINSSNFVQIFVQLNRTK